MAIFELVCEEMLVFELYRVLFDLTTCLFSCEVLLFQNKTYICTLDLTIKKLSVTHRTAENILLLFLAYHFSFLAVCWIVTGSTGPFWWDLKIIKGLWKDWTVLACANFMHFYEVYLWHKWASLDRDYRVGSVFTPTYPEPWTTPCPLTPATGPGRGESALFPIRMTTVVNDNHMFS